MIYDLSHLLEAKLGNGYCLHKQYINAQMAHVQEIIGFDKIYTRAEGAYLWDAQGNRYLDLLSGFSVFNFGRNHPVIKETLQQMLALDRPNLIQMDCPLLAGLLAEALIKRMPSALDKVYFSNSGSEAVETAIKFARAKTKRSRMLYLNHAYHGLTMGALSLNGDLSFRQGFGPYLEGFDQVDLNDLSGLEDELRKGDVAGFIIEPIQGKGVYIPDDNYFMEASSLCRKYGALLICDEVQTGMGRTGRFLCSEHWSFEPDIVTLSKSLGGGYIPVSATITRSDIYTKTFSSLDRCEVHATTFGQNELAMAAGLAALHVLDEEGLVQRAASIGDNLISGLAALKEKYEIIADVRGKGLMIGIEFRSPQSIKLRAAWGVAEKARKGLFSQLVVMALMRDHQMLTQVSGPSVNIIKLLPPLIIGYEEVEKVISAFDSVMEQAARITGRFWSQSGQLIRHAINP